MQADAEASIIKFQKITSGVLCGIDFLEAIPVGAHSDLFLICVPSASLSRLYCFAKDDRCAMLRTCCRNNALVKTSL